MILVTGGTGFIGRHLVNQLLAEGRPVRVLSRTPERHRFPPPVELVAGDLTDPASLAAALREVETIVHLAGVISPDRSEAHELARVNVDGTELLAGAARAQGIRRFVHISSAGVYGDGNDPKPFLETDPPNPATPYEKSKLSGEQRLVDSLATSEVQWTILRPTGVYGAARPATGRLFRTIAQRRWWLHGLGRAVVHPTYVSDLCGAIGQVIRHPGLHRMVINIGGARSLEFPELIRLIGKRVGHTPRQISVPKWIRGRSWINRSVNIEKARRQLGFEPVPLEWGLDETVSELRSRGVL